MVLCPAPHRVPGHHRPILTKHLTCHFAAARNHIFRARAARCEREQLWQSGAAPAVFGSCTIAVEADFRLIWRRSRWPPRIRLRNRQCRGIFFRFQRACCTFKSTGLTAASVPPIAQAKAAVPINYTFYDFLLNMLHSERAFPISISVTKPEQVGRTMSSGAATHQGDIDAIRQRGVRKDLPIPDRGPVGSGRKPIRPTH